MRKTYSKLCLSRSQVLRTRPIAIVNYDFRPSGTVGKSIEIATALQECGLPVELWVMRAEGPRLAGAHGVPIVELGSRGLTERTTDMLHSVPAVARAIRAREPTVLFSGGKHFHLPATLGLSLSGRRRETSFGGRASNSSYRPGQGAFKRLTSNAALRLKYSAMDFVVAVSTELRDEVVAKVPSLAGRVQCIVNGVDTARITEAAAQPVEHPMLQQGGPPTLVSMGRISKQKGFDLLLQALAMVNAQRPVRLIVIGDGPSEAIANLREMAAALGLAELVDFVGFMPNPFPFMTRANAFVLASRWEGASNALLEALACGLPLVATDCPTGNREIVQNGRYGTLARTEDTRSLAQAILNELQLDRDRSTQRAAAANYELEHCLAQYVQLLGRGHDLVLSRS